MDLRSRFFLLDNTSPDQLLGSVHDPWLVGLSVLVAVVTSYVALSLSDKVREAPTRQLRAGALAAGALSLGGGVWTMHFIGMLAFQICGQVDYDPLWTLGSILPSLGAAWEALRGLTRQQVSVQKLLWGGVWMGSGIGLMHYGGMAAVRSSAQLRYDPTWFLASIVVAVLLSTLALWLHHRLRRHLGLDRRLRTLLAACILGGAISGMHYTAMGAARFIGIGDATANGQAHLELAMGVALTALLVSVTAVGLNAALVQHQLMRDRVRSEVRLQALVDTAVDGVVRMDGQGLIVAANHAAGTIFGLPQAALVGQALAQLVPALAEQAAHFAGVIESSARRTDGQEMLLRVAVGHSDQDGELQRVAFVTDLTERHVMEQALRQAKGRAEEAAAAKSTFLANMSHEIRTPMNAIIGFSEVALEGEIHAEARQHLQIILRSARSLLGLLNDILDTAKLDHGAVDLEQQDFSLRQVFGDVMATMQIGADRKGLVLSLEVDEAVPAFHLGDPLRLQQILLNLVGNAVKFTEHGSVTLAAQVLGHGGLEVSVQDTGIGIAAERIERIFDPFAQADATMTRRFGGTGLGTTIARQLVQLMGGEIGVTSTPGVGSRFWFHLPLRVGQAPVGAAIHSVARALPPLRILAADDVPENLRLLEIKLGAMGHTVALARDGQEALERMQAGGLDLALLDVQMPHLDGLQACGRLRAHEATLGVPRLPVIALTASAGEDDRSRTGEAGMDGFVVKPIQWPLLLGEMARVLGMTIQAAEDAPPAPAASGTATPALPETVDWPQALAGWGTVTSWCTHLRRFLDTTVQGWPATTQDAALAHRLRGTCAGFGLGSVCATCAHLEQDHTRDHTADAQAWSALHARLVALRAALGATEAEPDSQPAGPAWPEEVAAALNGALARGELPEAAYRQVLNALASPQRTRLRDAVDSFDFDEARALLARYAQERA